MVSSLQSPMIDQSAVVSCHIRTHTQTHPLIAVLSSRTAVFVCKCARSTYLAEYGELNESAHSGDHVQSLPGRHIQQSTDQQQSGDTLA